VRPEQPGDREAIRRVHTAAFDSGDEAALVDALRGGEPWIAFVAVCAAGAAAHRADAELVGHVLLSRVDVGGDPALAVAPLAVLPAHQRAGVGTALTRAALAAATDAKERLVVVLGHPRYYPRFGFSPASRLGITAPYPVPDEAFLALELPGDGLVPRGLVTYPPAFGAL
jgi:predicted N-acetyltransferase YhbS